jgi:hypothetical protein
MASAATGQYASRVVLQRASWMLRIGRVWMNVTSRRGAATRVYRLPTLCVLVAALVVTPVAGARSAAKFVSHRYKYSVVLPGASNRWSAEFAGFNLPGSATAGTIHSPFTDVFTELKTERLYILASRPGQQNLQKWAQFVISIRPEPECGAPHSLPHTTLAGAPALAFSWSCGAPAVREGIMVAALHAGRGYFMLVSSLATSSRASEVRAFDAARRSFRFLRA